MKVESEKVGLKLNIQKTKIMASGPITSWEIDGETVETVADFLFLGSKITADGDCSHEIKSGKSHKRRSLVGYSPWGCKKSDVTELLNFLKKTFPDKVVKCPEILSDMSFRPGW